MIKQKLLYQKLLDDIDIDLNARVWSVIPDEEDVHKNTEEEIKELLSELYNVGKIKSLGYLTLESIMECNKTIDDLIKYANGNNIKTLLLEESECDIHSGALYFYDDEMLSCILNENKSILVNAKVPYKSCLDFIMHISNYLVSNHRYPKAFRVVMKTFNDKRLYT